MEYRGTYADKDVQCVVQDVIVVYELIAYPEARQSLRLHRTQERQRIVGDPETREDRDTGSEVYSVVGDTYRYDNCTSTVPQSCNS